MNVFYDCDELFAFRKDDQIIAISQASDLGNPAHVTLLISAIELKFSTFINHCLGLHGLRIQNYSIAQHITIVIIITT